jgi:arylsulfatase A-like enzyme
LAFSEERAMRSKLSSIMRGVETSALLIFALAATFATARAAEEERPPNLVVIFADDLGYGDLSCYGNPTLHTPELDRMAREGMKLTQFYAGACVCTPSRAALMTGRLPIRSGMCGDRRRVLFPNSKGGLPDEEITLAEALRSVGYATGCVGKWHLGHLPQYLPTRHGFDSYFGIPYSNDMDRTADAPRGRKAFDAPKIEYFNVPLLRGEKIVEQPADQTTLTRRYTEEAVKFIREHREKPFFLYLAHNLPHVPLFRSKAFAGHSRRGLYGDVVEEVDWSVGQVLAALRELQLGENTLVVFTSDNGPWLSFGEQGGSAGPLRNGKGTTWEGGMREPAVAWWPGKIEPGRVSTELASTMDLLATMQHLAGFDLPQDRAYDSFDLTPVLLGTGPSGRETMFYYRGTRLMAARQGPWKAHFATQGSYGIGGKLEKHDPPLLFHLEHDLGETHNLAAAHPEVISQIRAAVAEHEKTLQVPPSQLDR